MIHAFQFKDQPFYLQFFFVPSTTEFWFLKNSFISITLMLNIQKSSLSTKIPHFYLLIADMDSHIY